MIRIVRLPVRIAFLWCLVAGMLVFHPGTAHAGWQLVWSDEFDGASLDTTKWTFDIGNGSGGWGNNELEFYTSRATNVSVANGLLHIVARNESYSGFNYTSAKLKTLGLFSKLYGRFEFRAKLPQGQGYWPALWLMPRDSVYGGWAASGEVDIVENKGRIPTQVMGTLHFGGEWPDQLQSYGPAYNFTGGDSVTNFHVYALEWTTNQISWYVDGTLYQTQTSWSSTGGSYPAPFDQPFYIIMNLAVGGNFDGNPDGTTVFPGDMQIDYVRVYDYVPVSTPPAAPTGVTVSPGNAKVYLSWDASTSGATAYNVKRAMISGGTYTTVATPAANYYTDTGVSNCATYYYVVSATNSFGESADSSEKTAALGAFALAVSSGGSAAGQFIADANFSGGTAATPVTAAIDTSGLVAPAPQAVYQTERYGNFTYTFTNLIAGLNYRVRLHFAENYWTAAGKRQFNVSINGTQVLTNFDIFAVTGSQNKATIQEYTATPNSGRIVIQYTTVTDNAKSSGIEIILPPPAAPAGLTAHAGDSQVALNWSPSAAGAGYNLKRAVAGSGPYGSVSNGLASTNYTDTALTNGTTYYYVVSATLAGCESTNSAPASATPVCFPPPAPIAGNNGPIWTGMTLNLTASTIPGATYRWTGPNGFVSTNQNPSIANATADTGGLYSVTAAAGTCASAPGTTTVTVNPPAAVAIQISAGKVILSWPGGTLQSATNMSGPWDDVSGATSPRTNPAAASLEFYRIRLQ